MDTAMGKYDGTFPKSEEDADWMIILTGDTDNGYVVGLMEWGEVRGVWSTCTKRAAEAILEEKRREQRTLGEMLRREERGYAYTSVPR